MIRALFQKPCQCTIPDTTRSLHYSRNLANAIFQTQPEVCTSPETFQCLYDKSNVIYFLLIMIRDSGKKKCDTSLSNLFIFYCLTKI